jgi:WD40 repeat protein
MDDPRRHVRAFISYARADGEDFARDRVRARLEREHPEITLWQDRTELEAGIGWWRQIQDALDQVEVMILVLTPDAVASPIVAKEWRLARQNGVRVYPVEGPGLNFAALPRWMAKQHVYDLDREWATFVAYLKGPAKVHRIPFQAPDLPAGFVPRPREFEALKALLLDPTRRDPVAITTALLGAGGLGKTTLAKALCHDDDVQMAYDDGILWTTLGESPNLLDALAKLHSALTDDRPPFRDAEEAAMQLARRLEDRTCLIVLDDVWDRALLDRFPLRNPRSKCAWLITTRQVAVAAGARRVPLDEMTPEESVRMLTADLDPPPADLVPYSALARRLGHWPLLLDLVRAQFRILLTLLDDNRREVLTHIHQALDAKGLTAFDVENAEVRHQSFAKTVEVSLDLLKADQRRHFEELGIFPEDTRIPLATLRTLWGLDEFPAKELVLKLASLSLLKFDMSVASAELHDVIRRFVADRLPDSSKVHARLVDNWGDPLRLADDGYAWQRHVWHLVQAGRRKKARAQLLDLSWLQAKLAVVKEPTALLADYDLLPDDPDLTVVQAAIRLSTHALARDPSYLRPQLLGRLLGSNSPALARLVEEAAGMGGAPALLPRFRCFMSPGEGVLRILDGHAGAVRAVAVTPDGRRAVSASDDRTLRVWDLATGRAEHVLRGHANWIYAVAVTPDGRRAVSGSWDNTLRVWDLQTGAAEQTLSKHADAVTAVAVTPDGRRAVSASDDRTLRVWDLTTGRAEHTLQGHIDAVGAVAVTPDGRRAVSASDDRTLLVWDIQTRTGEHTPKGHAGPVTAIAVTPDVRRVVSGSDDKTLRVWDLATGHCEQTLSGHSGAVVAVAVTPDSQDAVSASWDDWLHVWSLTPGKERITNSWLNHSFERVNAVAVTPDGHRAVAASRDGKVETWRPMIGTRRMVQDHFEAINAVAVAPDGRHAVSASDDWTLRVWDLRGPDLQLMSWRDGSRVPTSSKDLVIVGTDGDGLLHIRTFDAAGDRTDTFETRDSTGALHLKSADASGTVLADEPESGLSKAQAGAINALKRQLPDWSPPHDLSPDVTSRVLDEVKSIIGHIHLQTSEVLHTLEGHEGPVRGVAMTPDGHRAVSASADKTLRVWDLATGRVERILYGHADAVNAVAMTPDGHRAVSASADKTLRVWDLATGQVHASFAGEGIFHCCAVGPDGSLIVAGDSTGRIYFLLLTQG